MLTIRGENALKVAAWIQSRGGVAVWHSINLSNPSGEWLTPARAEDGSYNTRPNWQCAQERVVITSLTDVEVETVREVKRFHIALRRSGNGLMFKCTEASSARIRREYSKAGEGSSYRFDYDTQEAVIEVTAEKISLEKYLQKSS